MTSENDTLNEKIRELEAIVAERDHEIQACHCILDSYTIQMPDGFDTLSKTAQSNVLSLPGRLTQALLLASQKCPFRRWLES